MPVHRFNIGDVLSVPKYSLDQLLVCNIIEPLDPKYKEAQKVTLLFPPHGVLIVCLPLIQTLQASRYMTTEGCFAGRICFAASSNLAASCCVQLSIENPYGLENDN